ncbi:MAG: undecaprenyl/decaprenyl-phosphate alpha-N-acetylglucosaminyl 1-phosphate transferase [Alphaproteobacteria bacterium]|nr:undecaprenyl/decaprenyl-phosphate alpha-N-acetylglucosaminyl 1-phosphate transferase [Alphaproteobacteria bacterium]
MLEATISHVSDYIEMAIDSVLHHIFLAGILLIGAGIITRYMLKRQILALPNHRSSHDTPTPSSGGVSIVLITLAGYLFFYFVWDQKTGLGPFLSGLVMASLMVAIVGFLDDLNRLPSFKIKLLSQIMSVAVLFACDLIIDRVTLPWAGTIELGLWGYIVTLVWVVGLTNAFNFMDGLDGMAGGTAIVAASIFALIAFNQGSIFVFVLSYIISASVLGFLFYNVPKARIFMGDVGSQFLGFMFAALAVLAMKFDAGQISFWVMPLLFFHFIFDTSYTFVRRLRAGEVVTDAHRSHLYQLVNRLGWSHPRVSLLYAGMCIVQGIAAIWFVTLTGVGQFLIFLAFILMHSAYLWIVIRAARARRLL